MHSSKQLISRIFFLIIFAKFITACSDHDYYIKELNERELHGEWTLTSQSASKTPFKSNMTLEGNGRIRFNEIPLVTGSYPDLTVAFITGNGFWNLIDKSNEKNRSRWKLEVTFTEHNRTDVWDVIHSGDDIGLFITENDDVSSGFEYRRVINRSP